MTCTCKPCPECGGTGYVYFDACTGEYLGNTDWEGWNSMEPCDVCDGSGIVDMCDECAAELMGYDSEDVS